MTQNSLKIGWAGLGNMGSAIVENLLNKGFSVTVYNRTKEKENSLIEMGAVSATTPEELTKHSEIIFTMVSDDEAVKEIFNGEHGILSQSHEGKLAVDMSTVSPQTSRFLADCCKKQGIEFIDAPVSGSIKPAKEGTLIIMAGGAKEAFEKAKPVFETIGKSVFYLGDNGAGTSAKLAINYFLAVTLQALSEMVIFAKQTGIPPKDILAILNEGALASPFIKMKATNIINNDFSPAFALRHLVKDVRLAGEQGIKTPLFNPVYESFKEAAVTGLADEDCAAIIKYLKNKTNG
jgi:3-hydroxyisobutyrate dehydrogenase